MTIIHSVKKNFRYFLAVFLLLLVYSGFQHSNRDNTVNLKTTINLFEQSKTTQDNSPVTMALPLTTPIDALIRPKFSVVPKGYVVPQVPVENGEERAQRVWQKCREVEESGGVIPGIYRLKMIAWRLVMAVNQQILYCPVGKSGSSNIKALFLYLNGKVADPYKIKDNYPHAQNLWNDNSAMKFVHAQKPEIPEKRMALKYNIIDTYYKMMFVRDPLQRLLSAYRDKFTGSNNMFEFRAYRNDYGPRMAQDVREWLDRPADPDLDTSIYDYVRQDLAQYNNVTLPLSVYLASLIFTPEFAGYGHKSEWSINSHWSSMVSLCQPCKERFRYDFIGKVETMQVDAAFLINKFNINISLPHISSTDPEALSRDDVQNEYNKLPELFKECVKYHLQTEARIWGYEGYDTTVKFRRHFEQQKQYDERDDMFPYVEGGHTKYYSPEGNI